MRIKNGLTTVVVSSLAATTFAVATPNVALADAGTTGEVAAALDTVDARNGDLVAEPTKGVDLADGKALTPHAQHHLKGTAYTLVADPSVGYIIWALIRCGAGGAVAWVTAIPFPWVMWARALWVAGGCILAIP